MQGPASDFTEAIASSFPFVSCLSGAFAVYCTRPETDTQVVLGSDLVSFLVHFQGKISWLYGSPRMQLETEFQRNMLILKEDIVGDAGVT